MIYNSSQGSSPSSIISGLAHNNKGLVSSVTLRTLTSVLLLIILQSIEGITIGGLGFDLVQFQLADLDAHLLQFVGSFGSVVAGHALLVLHGDDLASRWR